MKQLADLYCIFFVCFSYETIANVFVFIQTFCTICLCPTDASINAGYTAQDNRADFGPISSLPTILGNVPIILVVLKIILSDFPEVWGVVRVTESVQKNVKGESHRRTNARLICRLSRETKQYPIRKRADRRRKHNNTCHGTAQMDLDTIIAISSCHYQRLGLCHYLKALHLFLKNVELGMHRYKNVAR